MRGPSGVIPEGVEVFPNAEQLANAAAGCFVDLATGRISTHAAFRVALAGGSTPRLSYQQLASSRFAEDVDWTWVHVYWGDERCVPPDHPESNYRMARERLLDKVPIPAHNIHRIRGELEPAAAAQAFSHELAATFYGQTPPQPEATLEPPRFDLILLGMGDDGHTASLFPGTEALHENRRWVVPNFVERLNAWRVTLTLPVLNAADNVIFLVSGENKAERLEQVLQRPSQHEPLPSQRIVPAGGRLRWLVDQAAASLL